MYKHSVSTLNDYYDYDHYARGRESYTHFLLLCPDFELEGHQLTDILAHKAQRLETSQKSKKYPPCRTRPRPSAHLKLH